MTEYRGLSGERHPDWRGLLDNIARKGTPERVFHIELFHDLEIARAIMDRFGLAAGLDENSPDYGRWRHITFQRFCGFDFVRVGLGGVGIPTCNHVTQDTAALNRSEGRVYRDEHVGPITTWADFEAFEWPDPLAPEATADLEWWQENLPEDMCIVTGTLSHFAEWLCWLMGYETLCFALYDNRDLVRAIADKLFEINRQCMTRYLEYDRVRVGWGSDDMGFKTGPMLSPADLSEFVLEGHRQVAEICHAESLQYWLHSCGNLSAIMDELTDVVKIDAKHSFEDTIEDVRDVKATYGRQMAMLGGIDVDFLCRSEPSAIRQRVRETLDACQPGGGYCLGTGNSVANYIPVDNYLAMIDEGMLYGASR